MNTQVWESTTLLNGRILSMRKWDSSKMTRSLLKHDSLYPTSWASDADEPRHDVALLINGEKIYVSKQMLAIQAPIFNAMFYVNSDEKDKKEIELKDVDRKDFIDMLNLIYPSYEKILDSNVESLRKIADRFQIKKIIDTAEQFLIDSTKLTISSKLKLSDQFKLVKLQDHCLGTFKTMKEIMDLNTTDDFKALSDKAKSALLSKAMKLG